MESTMPPKNPPPGGEGGAAEGPPEREPRENKMEADENDSKEIFARAAGDEDGDGVGQQWAMHGAEEEEGRPDPRFHYDPQYQPQTGGPMDQTSSRHSYIDLTCLSPPPLNPAPPESFPTFSREQQGPLTADGDEGEDEGHHRRKMDRSGRGRPPFYPNSEDSGRTDMAWGREPTQDGADYETFSGNSHRSGQPFSPLRSFSNPNLTPAPTSHPNLHSIVEPEILPRNTSYESLHEID